jgi:hypothetical protein
MTSIIEKKPKMLRTITLSLFAAALATGTAYALPQKMVALNQEPGPGESPYQAGAKPLMAKPEGNAAIIRTMADQLGMIRLNFFKRPPGEELVDVVNRLQIGGTGTAFNPATKKPGEVKLVYGMALHSWEARLDVRVKDAAGKETRIVEVLSGDRAWNETAPGVGGVYKSDELRARRYFLALQPHAFARLAAKAKPETVKIVEAGGVTTVTVPFEGYPVTATLDQDYRPVKVFVSFKDPQHGVTTLEGNYGRYWDITEYGVMFPRDVAYKVNGSKIIDVKVDDARIGPYLQFPAPAKTASR